MTIPSPPSPPLLLLPHPVLAPTLAPISIPSSTLVPRQIMIISLLSPSFSLTPSTISSVSSLSSCEDYDVVVISLPVVSPASGISMEPCLNHDSERWRAIRGEFNVGTCQWKILMWVV